MQNGPELWSEILTELPGAIIAGGCVRDFLLGVEPKDVDVFINTEKYDEVVWPFLNKHPSFIPHPEGDEYEGLSEHCVFVINGKFKEVSVDIIGLSDLETGEKLVGQFDFAITRSWFDGTVHDTFEAMHDREKGCVTLMLKDRIARAWKRFDRFNERSGKLFTPVNFPLIKDKEELVF